MATTNSTDDGLVTISNDQSPSLSVVLPVPIINSASLATNSNIEDISNSNSNVTGDASSAELETTTVVPGSNRNASVGISSTESSTTEPPILAPNSSLVVMTVYFHVSPNSRNVISASNISPSPTVTIPSPRIINRGPVTITGNEPSSMTSELPVAHVSPPIVLPRVDPRSAAGQLEAQPTSGSRIVYLPISTPTTPSLSTATSLSAAPSSTIPTSQRISIVVPGVRNNQRINHSNPGTRQNRQSGHSSSNIQWGHSSNRLRSRSHQNPASRHQLQQSSQNPHHQERRIRISTNNNEVPLGIINFLRGAGLISDDQSSTVSSPSSTSSSPDTSNSSLPEPDLPHIQESELGSLSPISVLGQILLWGNIYSAMKFSSNNSSYITGIEVINWLQEMDVTSLTVSIYRAICIHCEENVQFLGGTTPEHHFLSYCSAPVYKQIYILTHNQKPIPPEIAPLLALELINVHQGQFHSLLFNYQPGRSNGLFQERKFTEFFADHLELNGRFRINKEYMSTCISKAIAYEHIDWIRNILDQIIPDHQSTVVTEIKKHSNRIVKRAPSYWRLVTKPLLQSILIELKPDLSEKLELLNLYPEIYVDLANLSQLARRCLAQSSNFVNGYLLGFPIHRYLPQDNELVKAARRLDHLGKDSYCEWVALHNKAEFSAICSHPGLPSHWDDFEIEVKSESTASANSSILSNLTSAATVTTTLNSTPRIRTNSGAIPSNERDFTLVDSIYDFSLYDIVLTQCGTKFNAFSRVEFDQILREKQNGYNQQQLDPGTISTLNDRQTRAKIMNLPVPKRLIELLTDLENNELQFPTTSSQSTGELSTWNRENAPLSVLRPNDNEGSGPIFPGEISRIVESIMGEMLPSDS